MRLNEIAPIIGSHKRSKRVGRGIGSGKGKTCGSGTKGQRSRTGVAIKGFEGGQMPIHRRLPKRGFTNIRRIEYQIINLRDLEYFKQIGRLEDSQVNIKTLVDSGVIKNDNKPVKLLGMGEISAAFIVDLDRVSEKARASIIAAGGQVKVKENI